MSITTFTSSKASSTVVVKSEIVIKQNGWVWVSIGPYLFFRTTNVFPTVELSLLLVNVVIYKIVLFHENHIFLVDKGDMVIRLVFWIMRIIFYKVH